MEHKSILIKDTTREEREVIVKNSMDYIDGKREIREINAEYMDKYRQGRNIM